MVLFRYVAVGLVALGCAQAAAAQSGAAAAPPPKVSLPVAAAGAKSPLPPAPAALPSDYVIGVDDVLSIAFWRDADMSVDSVVVRPDGKISLPILNELQAAGLTPDQLRVNVADAAAKFKEDPLVNVVVKQSNSRRVFLMGEVGKAGPYPLSGRLTVMQLLALAGGLGEYAHPEDIVVIRNENGQDRRFKVNLNDIKKGKNLKQNVELKVGDVVVVP